MILKKLTPFTRYKKFFNRKSHFWGTIYFQGEKLYICDIFLILLTQCEKARFFTATVGRGFCLLCAKHEQRLASRQKLEQDLSADCRLGHIKLKQLLQDKLGLQAGADISYTLQRGAPSGKQTAVQGIYYPYLTWSLFKDSSFGAPT